MDQEFGSSRHHNRHFVFITVAILVIAVALLYFLNGFGYFGTSSVKGSLTEQQCTELFSLDGVGFTELNNGNTTIKQATVIEGPSITNIYIEKQGNTLKCVIKRRSSNSLFEKKGLGASEYSCNSFSITYSGRSENNYYTIVKETVLPESSILNISASNPGSTGIAELDQQLSTLPESFSGQLEISFDDDRYIQETIYLSHKELYDSEINAFRNNECPSFFDIF